MKSRRKPFFALLALLTCTGCGGSEPESYLKYGDAAQSMYAGALEDFYSDNCLDAEPTFREVRRKYPYSRFAALAELRLADCLFNDGKYVEAIQAYEQFARRHPSHVEISYARFKVAQCYYEQIPSEWFLTPPAHQRDQGPAQQTLHALRRFIGDFPKDSYIPRARRMAKEATELLAKHELYVAKFYLDHDKKLAAIGRLRTLIQSYPQTESEPEALLLLGETYLEIKDTQRAHKAFRELVERFPGSDYADKARGQLGS